MRDTCSDDDIAELDICGTGRGGITTVEDAIDCATAAAYEIAASPDVASVVEEANGKRSSAAEAVRTGNNHRDAVTRSARCGGLVIDMPGG